MKYVSTILLILLAALLQAACSNQAVYTGESFASDSPFRMRADGDGAMACESARRALLGQGYLIDSANEESVKGRKAYRTEDTQNTFIEMNVVCLGEMSGTTLYATGVLTTYALKKSSSSASVGLSALGSISLPIGQSADSLVKVSEETIDDKDFYKRFFSSVDIILGEMRAARENATPAPASPVAAEPGPAPAPSAPPAVAPAPASVQSAPAAVQDSVPAAAAPPAHAPAPTAPVTAPAVSEVVTAPTAPTPADSTPPAATPAGPAPADTAAAALPPPVATPVPAPLPVTPEAETSPAPTASDTVLEPFPTRAVPVAAASTDTPADTTPGQDAVQATPALAAEPDPAATASTELEEITVPRIERLQ